jgi:hypothetical protein
MHGETVKFNRFFYSTFSLIILVSYTLQTVTKEIALLCVHLTQHILPFIRLVEPMKLETLFQVLALNRPWPT